MLKALVFVLISVTYVFAQSGIMSGRIDAVVRTIFFKYTAKVLTRRFLKTNLITLAGYESETHRIETEDGYLLKVHRILPRITREKKGPVLMIHGLFGTSADYILTGPGQALGKFPNTS